MLVCFWPYKLQHPPAIVRQLCIIIFPGEPFSHCTTPPIDFSQALLASRSQLSPFAWSPSLTSFHSFEVSLKWARSALTLAQFSKPKHSHTRCPAKYVNSVCECVWKYRVKVTMQGHRRVPCAGSVFWHLCSVVIGQKKCGVCRCQCFILFNVEHKNDIPWDQQLKKKILLVRFQLPSLQHLFLPRGNTKTPRHCLFYFFIVVSGCRCPCQNKGRPQSIVSEGLIFLSVPVPMDTCNSIYKRIAILSQDYWGMI